MGQSEHGHAQQFMKCLRDAENSRDVQPLCGLFSSDCVLENLTRPYTHSAGSGAGKNHSETNLKPSSASFWRQYLNAFERVESNFTHVIECGSTVVLEWKSQGKLTNGIPVDYNGVSILEVNNGQIEKFRTYYDSAALLPHSQRSDKHYSESVGTPFINTQAGS